MKKVIKLTESELIEIVKKSIYENEVEEGMFDGVRDAYNNVKDTYRGIKGMARGYGMDYFKSMSRLQTLVSKLKKLDAPNLKIMDELTRLKTKVGSMNIPQQRKNNLIALIAFSHAICSAFLLILCWPEPMNKNILFPFCKT